MSGVGPNLHFHHLPGTQIYTTHIYTKPKFTQHQIYTRPKFTRPQIYTTSNLQNPDLHKTRYTQPQFYTKPKFTKSQIYTVPNLQHQNLHQIRPNISFKGKDNLIMPHNFVFFIVPIIFPFSSFLPLIIVLHVNMSQNGSL